jgi:hypothetical protein
MAIRTGSLSRELAQEDPDILRMLLEDYKVSARRDRSSRIDFASGWLAALRRVKHAQTENGASTEHVPW